MNPGITALLSLQSKDSQIQKLLAKRTRLENQRKQIEETLAEEENTEEKARSTFNELRKLSQERSDEVDDLDDQTRKYEKQLEEGLLSFKEMESFREQIAHNKERMEQAEEEAIDLLNKVEEEAEKLKDREASFIQWKSRIEDEIREVNEEISAVSSKISEVKNERKELLNTVDAAYIDKYETLHESVDDPLAAIRDGRCSGCNLPLSQSTIERAREGSSLTTCENCMRILYLN